MKISKHIINLVMLSLFGFLLVLPFSLSRSKVDPLVLGIQSQKEYYKKIIGNTDKEMIRNLVTTEGKEKDAISLVITEGSTPAYFPLYDITNLANTPKNFVVYPSSDILGDMKDKVITLQSSNGENVVLYENSNQMQKDPRLEFLLDTGEKTTLAIIVEDYFSVTKDTPLSFDLTISEK